MKEPGNDYLKLGVLILLLITWGSWFILRTSYIVDGQRYFCLFDDAMISMSYARNLVEGYGLDWSRDGTVAEGFTSPLWLAAMVPVNALPLDLRYRGAVVQVFSLLLLAFNLVLVRQLVLRHFTAGGGCYWMPAAALTATYYPLSYWSLIGMETGLQAVLVTGSVILTLDMISGKKQRPITLSVLLTLAYLTRMDMTLLILACLLAVAFQGKRHSGAPRRWLVGLAVLISGASAYHAFRWIYFAEILPNTYYLKLTGMPLELRVFRGLIVFGDAVYPIILPLIIVTLGVYHYGSRNKQMALPAAVVLLNFAYSIYVGGDAWEESNLGANRFFVFVMPLIFVLLNAIANHMVASLSRHPNAFIPARLLGIYAVLPGTILSGLMFNGMMFNAKASDSWRNLLVAERPFMVYSHQLVTAEARALAQRFEPDLRVATVWAGTPAYFTDFKMVDWLGYNDRHIARLSTAQEFTLETLDKYVPGHSKWDLPYILNVRQPDIIFQTWGVGEKQLERALPAAGYVNLQLDVEPLIPESLRSLKKRPTRIWVKKEGT